MPPQATRGRGYIVFSLCIDVSWSWCLSRCPVST